MVAVALAGIAGVLAEIAAVVSLAVARDAAKSEHHSGLPDVSSLNILVFGLISALVGMTGVLYLLGAWLLFKRKAAGRVLIIVASVAAAAIGFRTFGPSSLIEVLAVFALCAATLSATVLPATGRWLDAGKQLRY
ncbi:hypothetical protein GCM10023318_01870 [Nocardia callitridis]|uniref:DUF2127 domain-containing protein n=2 Tax=Nocardia callitridis TaxID=648753 RepID=A0ABP9JTS9_9NOCA